MRPLSSGVWTDDLGRPSGGIFLVVGSESVQVDGVRATEMAHVVRPVRATNPGAIGIARDTETAVPPGIEAVDLVAARHRDGPSGPSPFDPALTASPLATVWSTPSLFSSSTAAPPVAPALDEPWTTEVPHEPAPGPGLGARQREELAATREPQAEGRMSATARKVSAVAVHAAVKRWFPLFGLVPTTVVEQAIGFGDRLLTRRSRSGRAAAEARDELLSKRRAATASSLPSTC